LRGSVYAFGKFLEALRFGKDDIRKRFVLRETLQVAGTEALDKLLVIGASDKSAAADHGKVSFAAELNSFRKTLKSGVTLVLNRVVCFGRFRIGGAAIRIAKFDVVGRALKCVTDRIVVGDNDSGRLITINQKQGKARGVREPVLDIRPGRRSVLAVLLRVRGNGGLLHHRVLGKTIQVCGRKRLNARPGRSELPSSAHEEFTLVLNIEYQRDFNGCDGHAVIVSTKTVQPR